MMTHVAVDLYLGVLLLGPEHQPAGKSYSDTSDGSGSPVDKLLERERVVTVNKANYIPIDGVLLWAWGF